MIVTQFALYLSVLIYSFLFDYRLVAIYLSIIAIYYLIYLILPSNGKQNSLRRKIQIASWEDIRQGPIQVNQQIDCTATLAYLKNKNKDLKDPLDKVTFTHVCTKAFAQMFQFPDINGRIICGKYIPFQTVNINVLCDIDNGSDLAVIQVEEADKLNISQIAQKVNQRVSTIKTKKDKKHAKQIKSFTFMPPFLITICFDIVNFLCVGLGMTPPGLGFKNGNIHGSCMITNIGMLGHVNTFAPHNIATKVVTTVAINAIQDTPVVQDGQVVVRPMCNLNLTMDHRYLDGGKSKKFIGAVLAVFANPSAWD